MISLDVRTDIRAAVDSVRRLGTEVQGRATASALNKVAAKAKTEMSRRIRDQYNISATRLRERLVVRRASYYAGRVRLSAQLIGTGKRSMNVIAFALPGRKTLRFRFKRGGAIKAIAGAFLGNKQRTVFRRVPGTRMQSRRYGGKHGERIEPVQVIDVPQMFNVRRINEAVRQLIMRDFPKIFASEMNFYSRRGVAS